jgi:hypothetical protein
VRRATRIWMPCIRLSTVVYGCGRTRHTTAFMKTTWSPRTSTCSRYRPSRIRSELQVSWTLVVRTQASASSHITSVDAALPFGRLMARCAARWQSAGRHRCMARHVGVPERCPLRACGATPRGRVGDLALAAARASSCGGQVGCRRSSRRQARLRGRAG